MPASPRFLLSACLVSAALLCPVSAADFTVSTHVDSGPGSLRQAILDANAAPGSDVIVFTLDPVSATASTPQINVMGALPDITDPLTMAGIYQVGTASSAAVEIRSTGLDAGQSILTVTSGGTTLRNLNFVSLTAGTVGLTLSGGGGNTLENLRVGITFDNQLPSAGRHGVVVASDDNTITGCRICAATEGDGLRITGSRNQVKGNNIGFKSAGIRDAGNGVGIHLLGGSDNVVGPAAINSSTSNQISANLEGGIHIQGGTGHRILANWVDAFNSVSPNGTGTAGFGIKVDGGASGVEIAGARISSTNGINLAITGPAGPVRVSGSTLGGSKSHGIFVGAGVSDLIVEDSTISSNAGAGIHLEGGSTPGGPVLIRHNEIIGNLVGVDVAAGMGQVTIGTRRDNLSAFSNKIAANRNEGVLVRDPGARVRVSENAMVPISPVEAAAAGYRNTIPVNLKPLVEDPLLATANDPLDEDTGPNGLQNKPVITAVEALAGNDIRIAGFLNAKPSTTYVIEALQHSVALKVNAPFLAGYLGSSTVTTDASGNAPISMQLSGSTAGWRTALTATSPEGETSEYSDWDPLFPLLWDQTSMSFPESESETGSAFIMVRPKFVTGTFNAIIMPSGIYGNGISPFKYRFNAADPWTMLKWTEFFIIPFAASDDQRVIYLAANDDHSWDPTNKPGQLVVNYGSGISKQVPLLFPDNDPPPVFMALNHGSIPIGQNPTAGPAAFFEDSTDKPNIRLIADRLASQTVNYKITLNTAQSTAVLGQDFSAPWLPFTNYVPQASLMMQSAFPVNPIEDTLVEGDEVISFNIESTTPGFPYSAVVPLVIGDNDFYQTSVADASVIEGNTGATRLYFPVTINQALPSAVTFDWVAAPGTATSPSDFTAGSGTITIAAGTTSAAIQIEVNGDTAVEANETFTVTLSNPGGADVRIADGSAVGTITNDDFPSVSLADLTVSEAAGNFSLTATLSEPAPFAAAVGYTLVHGTAIRSSDFIGFGSGTLNFPAGGTTASIGLTILNDTLVEPHESFTVQLGNPSNLTLGNSSATVTIVDDDAPALLTPLVVSIVEGDTGSQTIPVTLTLNSAALRAGSLNWQVSAASTAVESASGTVSFAPGATTASLSLTLPGNLIPQPVRSVKLQLSNPVEVGLPLMEITVASITDNDQHSLTGNAVSLAEGNGGTTIALFPISIAAPLEVPVSVQYQTIDATALAGSDYAAASGTATIPAGSTGTDIPITIIADASLELAETFRVQLSAPVNATLGSVSLAGTIQNDDAQPTLQVSPATVTSGPGGPFLAWIEIKLPEAAASLPVPVAYKVTSRDGTALAGIHYTPISGGVLTFPAGNGTPVSQWITVSVAGNEEGSADRPTSFQVDFSPVSGPASVVGTEVKIEPLRVTDFTRLGLGFYTVSFPTGIAQNYVIQQAAALTGPWSDKTSVIPGTGNPVGEYLLFSSQPQAYFRVRSFTTPPASPAVLAP